MKIFSSSSHSSRLLSTIILFSFSYQTFSASLHATVTDQNGKPVVNAVVLAATSAEEKLAPPAPAEIDQINKEFTPYVLPVRVGTLVSFPNKDKVRHHVYSFSPAKIFDLPLYSGTSAPPILIDKPGIIVIGCNIHDWMIGYIYATETPYFAKTAQDGAAALKNLPAGNYSVWIWHPDMKENEQQTRRNIVIETESSSNAEWRITLNPRLNIKRGPSSDSSGY